MDFKLFDEHFDSNIKPILDKYGATAEKNWPFPEPEPLRSPPDPLTITTKDGVTFDLPFSHFNKVEPKALEHFLKYFDRFAKCEEQLQNETDPFYDSVYGRIKTEFGKRSTINTDLGYHWICSMIRDSGRRIWS